MTHPLDREHIRDIQQQNKRLDLEIEKQFRQDVQDLFNSPGGRRVIWRFQQQVAPDNTSAFNTNAMAQSHAIGKRDAWQWWLNVIREYCPEKEAQLRKEARLQSLKKVEDTEHEQ